MRKKKISLITLLILLLFMISCLSPNHRATSKYEEDKELEKVFSKEEIILIIQYSNSNEFEKVKDIVEDDVDPDQTLYKYQLLSNYFKRNLHSDKYEKLLDLAITYAEIHENNIIASEFKIKKEELEKKREFILSWTLGIHHLMNQKMKKK